MSRRKKTFFSKMATENIASAASNKLKNTDASKILTCMRYFNVLNSAVVILAGVLSFMSLGQTLLPTDPPKVTIFFLSVYICVFGLLWLAFEVRLAKSEVAVRKMFGFLFRPVGRTIFILLYVFFSHVDSLITFFVAWLPFASVSMEVRHTWGGLLEVLPCATRFSTVGLYLSTLGFRMWIALSLPLSQHLLRPLL